MARYNLSLGDPGPFAGGLLPHEAAVLQAEQLPELAGHGNENEVGVLAARNALTEVVQAGDLVAARGGGQPVTPAARGQLAHQQPDGDEKHLGGDVRRAADPERAVGTRQEEVEGRRRHQGGRERPDPAPTRRNGHRDHHEDEGVVGAVQMVPAGNEEERHGDRRRHGHGPLGAGLSEQPANGSARCDRVAAHSASSPEADTMTS